ncbi:hypothetical protein VPH35_048176 [Triticum aestivum]
MTNNTTDILGALRPIEKLRQRWGTGDACHIYPKSILRSLGPSWPSSRLSSSLAWAKASSLVPSSAPLSSTVLTALKMGFHRWASRFTTPSAHLSFSASLVSGLWREITVMACAMASCRSCRSSSPAATGLLLAGRTNLTSMVRASCLKITLALALYIALAAAMLLQLAEKASRRKRRRKAAMANGRLVRLLS